MNCGPDPRLATKEGVRHDLTDNQEHVYAMADMVDGKCIMNADISWSIVAEAEAEAEGR